MKTKTRFEPTKKNGQRWKNPLLGLDKVYAAFHWDESITELQPTVPWPQALNGLCRVNYVLYAKLPISPVEGVERYDLIVSS